MRLLVVEDEIQLADALSEILKRNMYNVDTVYDGIDGLDNALTGVYDCIILDIMLPNMNGLEVLRRLRQEKINTPVLLLTAKSEIEDKINGLDSGADDYLTKPISMGELLARIRAAARRGSQTAEAQTPVIITFSNVSLNTSNAELSAVNSISLAAREMRLLELLASADGKPFTGDELFGKLWRDEPATSPKVVEVYISYLRNKLRAVGALCTITGDPVSGYVLG